MTEEAVAPSPLTPEMQKARTTHRISIATLVITTAVFLLGTMVLDLPMMAERILYVLLTGATLFFMFATMVVMIHKRA